jgi:hypothetical protein
MKHRLLLSFLIYTSYAVAQEFNSGKWGFEATYLTGSYIKHSPEIIRIPSSLSHGAELVFFKKTLGEKSWHMSLNFPEVGGGFSYYHFGDNDIFGDAYTIMGFSKFFLFRSKYVNGFARIGGGVSFLTKTYDYLRNPENNIVASTINKFAQLRLGLEWKVSPYASINTSFTFSHISSSAIKLPNYGINMALGSIGVKVYPQLKTLEYNCVKTKPVKKNEIMIRYSLGLHEAYTENGPVYPVHIATVLYSRYTSHGNKVFGGFSFEFLQIIRDITRIQELGDRNYANMQSFFPSLYLGDEIMVGNVGIFFGTGIYLKKNDFLKKPVYFKTGGHYYFYNFGKNKGVKLFVGTNVKSHLFVAQFWEFSSGVCF